MAIIDLIFSISRSKLYTKAVKKAKAFPAYTENNGQNLVTIPAIDIFKNWDSFHSLFIIIADWKGFKIQLDGQPFNMVNRWKLYYKLQDIKNCYKSYLIYNDVEYHCNQSQWKCTWINAIELKPIVFGNFWYKYGHFDENYKNWIIHKKEIFAIVSKQIEEKLLPACPAFNIERVYKVIHNLPDYVNIEGNTDWEIIYEKRFVGSSIKDIPVSIKHILDEDSYTPRISINIIPYLESKGVYLDETEVEGDSKSNPYPYGTDDWANWEIDNFEKSQ